MYCADSSEWELFGRNTRSAIRGTSSPRKYSRKMQTILQILVIMRTTSLRRVARLHLRGHRPRYARPPRSYCHSTQPKTRENRVESKLSAFFFGFMRILLYLRTSACWINSYHAMLERIFQHSPVATATLRSPYSIHSHIFWQIRLRLLNIPLTLHSYKRASVVNVIGIFNR